MGDQGPRTLPPKVISKTLMAENWDEAYEKCPVLGPVWDHVTRGAEPWAVGYQVRGGKLYHDGLLCIPESMITRVLREHHQWNAHVSNHRLMHDIGLRYEFPPGCDIESELDPKRRFCLVCHPSHPPNWQVRQPIAMTPIPPRVMFSVSLDVFSMPKEMWEGVAYDAFLLCVDRHCG